MRLYDADVNHVGCTQVVDMDVDVNDEDSLKYDSDKVAAVSTAASFPM